VSSVSVIDACPMSAWTAFGGSSRPPSDRALMHHDAKKCRKECRPVYFGSPDLSTTEAAFTAACSLSNSPRWWAIPPSEPGNTRPSSPLGQASLHAFSAGSNTSWSVGTVRLLDADLGAPIARYLSALCRTWSSQAFRSTSDQRNPRSSLDRKPVSATVNNNARVMVSVVAATMRLLRLALVYRALAQVCACRAWVPWAMADSGALGGDHGLTTKS